MLVPQSLSHHSPMQLPFFLAALALLMPFQVSVSLLALVYSHFTCQVAQFFQPLWFGNYEGNHRKEVTVVVVVDAAALKIQFYAVVVDS